MPIRPKTKGVFWKYFFADGRGEPNLNRRVPGREAYSYRAAPVAAHRQAHEIHAEGVNFKPEGMGIDGDGGIVVYMATPDSFVRSCHGKFELTIYLALTAPLRELGA